MQQGRAGTRNWVVEFERQPARSIDPLMGWTSSSDTREQLHLAFAAREEAVAYCERQGIDYVVEDPQERQVVPKSYASNFRWDRVEG